MSVFVRRLNAKWQELMISVGEWMLATFPFLLPPAHRAVEHLNRLAKRLGL